MKKLIFTTLLFCGLSFTSQSQSLTYSKVILLTSLDTVPQGKVWKLVSVLPSNALLSGSSTGSWYANSLVISVNGASITLAATINNAGYRTGYSAGFDFLPMWLPSGTIVAPNTNCHSISIIEFIE
ncbi:MAG: hypothetical protein VX762_04940 [Bacteroidota bacterium]|nr:hypothetical protein [Bacteroidota bacterium]